MSGQNCRYTYTFQFRDGFIDIFDVLYFFFYRTSVDYFSLDVEGNEMDILRTIPFEDVDIKAS